MGDRSVRVCVLTTSFPRWEGDEASVFVGRLVQAFSDIGLSGVVVAPRDDSERAHESSGSFEIFRYRYGILSKGSLAYGHGILPNLKRNPLLFLQIPSLLFMMLLTAYQQRKTWDVIHANWVVSGCVAYVLSALTAKPYVVTVRGEDAKLLTVPLLGLVLKYVLRRASKVVSVNEAFLSELPAGATCIPNGTEFHEVSEKDERDFALEKGLSTSVTYLLFIGRLIPLKRVETLIDMMAAPCLKDFILLLVGRADSDYGETLQERAKRLGVNDRVRFEGSVPYREIRSYLSIGALYLSASSHEGRSNSMLEALAAGLPVVASDIEGHAELITHGENGILFPDDEDTHNIAAQVAELVQNPDRYRLLSKQSRESVAELSWESSARSYGAVFDLALRR